MRALLDYEGPLHNLFFDRTFCETEGPYTLNPIGFGLVKACGL